MKIKTPQNNKEKPIREPKPPKTTDNIIITLPVANVKQLSVNVFEDEEFTKEIKGAVTELIHRGTSLILNLAVDIVEDAPEGAVWIRVNTEGHVITLEVENDD